MYLFCCYKNKFPAMHQENKKLPTSNKYLQLIYNNKNYENKK